MRLATFPVAMLIASSLPAAAQTPVIQAVFNPATLAPPVSPGMPVVINGINLAGGSADCPGPKVPLTCGSVSVTVNNRATPVRFVYPSQLTTYIPVDQPAGTVSVVVKNHQGAVSAPFFVAAEQYAPGIQKLSDTPGSVIGFFSDTSQRAITHMNPASPGQELFAYAVGLGPTVPQVPTGEVGSAPMALLPSVFVANRAVPVISGALGCGALCDPGIYMVRFSLPPDIPSGDQPVTIEIAGRRSIAATLVVGPPMSGPAVGYLQSQLDPAVRTMSPGAVANVVGAGFLTVPGGISQCSIDPSYWPLTCQGVTVTINGRRAAIQTMMSNSITIQIPVELSPGPATLVVERTSGSQTLRSTAFQFTLDAVSPTLPVSPASRYTAVVIQNSGGLASATNPMLSGDTVEIYASGLGQTNPPLVTGFSLLQPARTVLIPSVNVGGKPLLNVLAEALPMSIGQYRITATVPAGLGKGDLPIVVEIGGKKSQDGLLVPVASDPVIAAVTNAASGGADIVSGSWVSIYGRNLAATRREWREDDIRYDWLPTTLDGVNISINNKPAVVAYVSPMQINVLAPDDLPSGPVEVILSGSTGWQKTTANVKPYAPGLFVLQAPPPPGTGGYVLATHADWAYVARPGQMPQSVPARPAQPGETIVLFGTGFGRTEPQVSAYHRFSGSAPLSPAVPVRVQIGPAQAKVLYAGMVGSGLYQLNVVVPELPNGDYEVIVSMGDEASPKGRFMPVVR